ncbi:hypothetical protein G4B88_011512 [Cannabis sativa]|uniref:Uncharacterized protein n=2 Tax=Cannabis sativa TaxID=3483 RepID=A0A7J6F5Z9_CANSA|nr:hypothetical protein G4B88_000687 [Cannabis sativa]KAF4391869.1 hypothetical protein G4B88_011512 [Cannabis sativa]
MMKQEMLLSYVVLQTNLLYGCSCGEDDWNQRCICVKECPFENVLRLGSPWELVAVLRARNQFFFGNRAFDLASVSRQVFEDVVEFTRIQDKLGTKSVFTQTAQLSFINVPCIWVEKNVCEEFQWACKYGVTWLQGNHYENLTTQKMECVSFVCIPSPTMNEYKIHKAMDFLRYGVLRNNRFNGLQQLMSSCLSRPKPINKASIHLVQE